MRYVLFTLIFAFLFVSCQDGKSSSNYTKLSGSVFGTTYHISYDSDTNYSGSFDSIFALTNKSLSTYIQDSDISRINRGAPDVIVDEYFIEVFNKSQRIYKESEGMFDPTIGLVVNAYGFGPEQALNKPPKELIDKKMLYVGFDKVSIVNSLVVKEYPEIYFDFNSIAKGYGVDLIGRFLETKDIANYMVEIGGEIRVRGFNDKGKLWTIAIEQPNFDMSRSVQEIIELNNESIATSGNYRKFKVDKETGEKYVHTIDALSGEAKQSDLLSASVISQGDCADMDAYATLFMAFGFEQTKTFLLEHPELKVVLVYLDENGDSQVYQNWE